MMSEDAKIVDKLYQENLQAINRFYSKSKKYSSTILLLRNKNLMSEEVAKSSKLFDTKLAAIDKTLANKEDLNSFKELLPKLPTVIENIENTNIRLEKYLTNKLAQSNLIDQKANTPTLPDKQKKEHNGNRTKRIIFFLAGIAILIGVYFAFNKYSESIAFDKTIANESIENYQNYLRKYPSHSNTQIIDQKFQQFLLREAIDKSSSKYINTLARLYPTHTSLKNITVASSNSDYTSELKGVLSSTPINKINDKYLIPEGCKIHVSGKAVNKKEINKYFTVLENKQISLIFINEKDLLLNENFIDNSNMWEYATSHDNLSVKIENGFTLFHNNPAHLPYILLDKGLSKSDDYEIELDYSMKKGGNIYLLFSATDNAFSFFGINQQKQEFWVGHNNYHDVNNRWVSWTNKPWQYDNRITRFNSGKIENHKISIIKKGNRISFKVGEHEIFEESYKAYYGNKIGISVNHLAMVTLNNLKIHKYNEDPKINYRVNETYYCSATKLNVRLDGAKTKVLTTISKGESIKFVGGIKDFTKATYFGKLKPEYYYAVKLNDGTFGWVHGGGLNEI